MKGFNEYSDLFAVGIGVIGSLLKSIKAKLKIGTLILGCIVAGILTYCATGIIEIYFAEISVKVVILISFSVGWVSNEITQKMDAFIGDFYNIIIAYIKTFFKR